MTLSLSENPRLVARTDRETHGREIIKAMRVKRVLTDILYTCARDERSSAWARTNSAINNTQLLKSGEGVARPDIGARR